MAKGLGLQVIFGNPRARGSRFTGRGNSSKVGSMKRRVKRNPRMTIRERSTGELIDVHEYPGSAALSRHH